MINTHTYCPSFKGKHIFEAAISEELREQRVEKKKIKLLTDLTILSHELSPSDKDRSDLKQSQMLTLPSCRLQK